MSSLSSSVVVWVTKSLRKYDHVSSHCHDLNWLSVSHQIKLRSVCATFFIITREDNVYNWTHLFGMVGSIPIRLIVETILQVSHCVVLQVLRATFRFAATTWWNSLPSHICDCISNSGNFTKAIYEELLYGSLYLLVCVLFYNHVVVTYSILYVLLYYLMCACVVILCMYVCMYNSTREERHLPTNGG